MRTGRWEGLGRRRRKRHCTRRARLEAAGRARAERADEQVDRVELDGERRGGDLKGSRLRLRLRPRLGLRLRLRLRAAGAGAEAGAEAEAVHLHQLGEGDAQRPHVASPDLDRVLAVQEGLRRQQERAEWEKCKKLVTSGREIWEAEAAAAAARAESPAAVEAAVHGEVTRVVQASPSPPRAVARAARA